jgi:hypothetical protein
MWRFSLIGGLCVIAIFSASAQNYEQDVISQDGPIIYGTGMTPEDSREAWKHFFYMMTKAVLEQQGQEVLGLKLKPRRDPKTQKCTIALDAKLTGIGRIPEPRRVLVMVLTDCENVSTQFARIVCTYPAQHHQVCRDFDTGQLLRE